jgi:carbonic anhydrase
VTSPRLYVVTCMDAHLDPAASYSIPLGDAIIIRNVGAGAKDAFRSLIISKHLLGINEVFIKHTRCRVLGATNEMARGLIGRNLGPDAVHELED